MLFLGCDSGATKIAFALCDETGRVLALRAFPGITPLDDGRERYAQRMGEYIRAVLAQAAIGPEALTCAAFALTCYGESPTAAQDMEAAVAAALGPAPRVLVSDAVAGWSGALRGRPGICVVAGTGSIAYGEDGRGGRQRVGGWSVLYGDEGSSYWVAVQAVNAFYRQADGRMPRTALYGFFMDLLDIRDPLFFPGAFDALTDGGETAKVAAFQRQVLRLYELGDPCARDIYARAAEQLARLVQVLCGALRFSPGAPVDVTYSGGLFRAGDCILRPFERCVAALGARLIAPAYGPLAGAVGYAARNFVDAQALEQIFCGVQNCEALNRK